MFHSKDTFIENTAHIAFDLKKLYQTIIDNDFFIPVFEPYLQGIEYNETVRSMMFSDILKCAERLKHLDPYSDEFIAIRFTFFCLYYDPHNQNFEEWATIPQIQESTLSFINTLMNSVYYNDGEHFIFIIVDALWNAGYYGYAEMYFQSLYDLSYALAYADGYITYAEKLWIELFDQYHEIIAQAVAEESNQQLDYVQNDCATTNYGNLSAETETKSWDNNSSEVEVKDTDEIENPIEVLKELIGLNPVKKDITSLRNLIKMQKMRESKGIKTANISYHCVFTGNPGTGKTTVARILASIYKELGILKSGHLIETDRSGLVADYVGQTATKTNAIIDKALDGVLFIDEAYALAQGGDNDFGKEAISTLLKRMEDDRTRLIVILAGYNKEMGVFLNSNSGLQSRFSRYIDFPDYDIDELVAIFKVFLKQNQYIIEEKAMEKVRNLITRAYISKDEKFGNARYVRNLFETIITNQANRLSILDDVDKHTLTLITKDDI